MSSSHPTPLPSKLLTEATRPTTISRMATPLSPNILMVYPRFNPHSFWSLRPLCELLGARSPEPPLGLLTVAALLPPAWNIRLVNRNAEDLTDSDLAWADLVMTGGMLFQQNDTLAIIDRAHAHGKPVVIGGPDVTLEPGVLPQRGLSRSGRG